MKTLLVSWKGSVGALDELQKSVEFIFWCTVLCRAGFYFFASDNFQGIFVDSRSMMFTKVLMKELACILIHVRKIFNCRVSFKLLLFMYLVTAEKKLWHSCDWETFGLALSKKYQNSGRNRFYLGILSWRCF